MQAIFPAFVLSLLLVPMAASVSTLLVLWEAMALTSLALVSAEHEHRSEVRDAAWWYGTMSHLSMVVILLGLVIFAGHADGETFASLRSTAADLSDGTRATIFLAAVIGFGAKAGIVPLHVWLPRAHPEAPSHISALMSGAMVKLGIYGIVRIGWDLLGGGPLWWGMLVLGIGVLSALFGILHALIAGDLKRLLAYSTSENVGLILVGVGAAGMYAATGDAPLAGLALTAAMLHVVNHAAFKGLLFLGAGAVLTATGTRDLDEMGGLLRRMPVTGAAFAVGSLAIAALPPFNGFVSEWLLVKALVQGASESSVAIAITMPLAVGAVALTGGLAAATFIKAFGIGFLARPRTEQAARAVEVRKTMQVGMMLLVAACIVLAFVPTSIIPMLAKGLTALTGFAAESGVTASASTLTTAGLAGSMSPLILGTTLVLLVALIPLVLRLIGVRSERRVTENWGSGRAVQSPRMEYTATSFAQPLQRVFDDIYRPETDLQVSHHAESSYFVQAVQYRVGIVDVFEKRFYQPAVRLAVWWGDKARWIQGGSIHRYLAYSLVALIMVLVISR
jgi:formate hydrogenlyase subunit 3/multisubunit Na+/H+ antiporter MnhD subunit